jgi:NADH:ubiquinone oxidoreductase subunit 6 (subunit J)
MKHVDGQVPIQMVKMVLVIIMVMHLHTQLSENHIQMYQDKPEKEMGSIVTKQYQLPLQVMEVLIIIQQLNNFIKNLTQ